MSSRTPRRRLVKLDQAARRLGCHVETLRLRIRRGQLEAVRGAHGAYYIPASTLGGLLASRLHQAPESSPEDLPSAWRIAVHRLWRDLERKQDQFESFEDDLWRLHEEARNEHELELVERRIGRRRAAFAMVGPFLRALQQEPSLRISVYRLLCGQGLGELGYRPKQAAALLGVSARHARRLLRRQDLTRPVLRAARAWAFSEARRLLRELRTELAAGGFSFNRLAYPADGHAIHPKRPRPASRTRKLTRDQRIALRRAGLSPEQIWAVTVVGLGVDELNEFFLRG